MMSLIRTLLLSSVFTLTKCFSTDNVGKADDIPMARETATGTHTDQGKPIVLEYKERINWETFFQPAPTDKERAALLRTINVNPNNDTSADLLKRAKQQLALGQLVAAEATLKLALRKEDQNPELLIALAECSVRKHLTDEAYDYLSLAKQSMEGLVRRDADLIFRYRYLLALTHLNAGDDKAAHAILTDLVRLDKTFVPAYVVLAHSYLENGKTDIAEFIARRGLDRGKESAALYNILGMIEKKRGALSEARTMLQKALALDANHAPTLINFASLLAESGDREAAELNLRRAVALSPGDFSSHLALAQCQRMMGQFDYAKSSFERAIELNPNSAQARFSYAQLLHENFKEKNKALRLYQEVVQLNDPIYASLADGYIKDLLAKGL